MGTTFLALTNKVLKRLNEVELDSDTFTSPRGIHAAAKDAVLDAIDKIYAQKFEWPFNKTEGEQLLVVGQEFYDWPADYKIADWNSFYIELDDTLSVGTSTLKIINRDEWYRKYRNFDLDSEGDGLAKPIYVFKGAGESFGVSPSPDQAYTVKFKYFKHPTKLSLHSDTVDIPENFDYVIMSGAMWYMYLWRDNEQRASMAESEFKDNMQHMTTLLINEYNHVTDTRVKF